MLLLKPVFQGRSMLSLSIRTFYFHFAYEFSTRTLAYLLDSLVRVSRRDKTNLFDKIAVAPQASCDVSGLLLFCLSWLHFAHLSVRFPRFLAYPIFKIVSLFRFLLNDFRSFHSLFKVLFIFPSQYLFAIGLPSLFSFGRFISPSLGCSSKQPDSFSATFFANEPHGPFTLFGMPFDAFESVVVFKVAWLQFLSSLNSGF